MVALVYKCLTQELLDVLQILLINNFGEHSECISLEHIVIGQLNIFGQTTDDNEHFILIHIKLFNQHVHQPSQVLIQLVPLRLWNLEQLGHIEK